MISTQLRELVRQRFKERCGYCGVPEANTGHVLELDHFQPRSVGGTDEPENLVYCCTPCNRHKGDFWPADSSAKQRLLHPLRDDLAAHIREDEVGRLIPLTETGRFHLDRLQLNHPARIALRRQLRAESQKKLLAQATREREQRMRQELEARAERIQQLFDEIDRISNP